MNLSTTYLGFELPHPIVAGASPLVDDLDVVRRLEDAGAPMIIMHSLFEEQIVAEELGMTRSIETPKESYAEALSYLPEPDSFVLGPDEYLGQLQKIKAAVGIPVVGSLNGTSVGGWLRYARLIQEAGADALELNMYEMALDPQHTGTELEQRGLDVVQAVKSAVTIPVAVKLSPFYSAIANYCQQLDEMGVDALVLFNRFYQPDIDVQQQEMMRVNLSDPSELLLRLRWIGALFGSVRAALAATGGVHTATDVVKTMMAGANVAQMVSALLLRGPEYLRQVRVELAQWLETNQFESVRQMQGSMSLLRCDNPAAYSRANYARLLQSWSPR